MRSVRSELLGLSVIAAMPVAIMLVFPYSAVGFKARTPPPHAASVAFVELDESAEAEALNSARTLWRMESSASRRLRARLPLAGLPDDEPGIKLQLPVVDSSTAPQGPAYRAGAWCPSTAVRRLVQLPASPVKPRTPAFPRSEMLELK